ncbi:MAG: hypothetical protein JNJ56_03520 [Ignavibacteria bacterium]|nr:hypothetical protein [Ignavibacteria bacterium]
MAKLIKKAPKAVNDEKKDRLIQELLEVLNRLGLSVRIEKGVFKGGFCLLREQKIFLLNKNLDQDRKISILLRQISESGTDDIFLKPQIREMIEKESGADKLL